MSNFEAIASQDLNIVCGGDGQPPPAKVDGRDVIDVTKAATRSVLNPLSMPGQYVPRLPISTASTRKDRVGKQPRRSHARRLHRPVRDRSAQAAQVIWPVLPAQAEVTPPSTTRVVAGRERRRVR